MVTLSATPAFAKIYFDDAPLEGNPATATFRRDSVKHRVRAEARGFESKVELMTLEGARMTMDLALEPEPALNPAVEKPVPDAGTERKIRTAGAVPARPPSSSPTSW